MLSKHFQPKHLQIAALLALLQGIAVRGTVSAQEPEDRPLPRLVSKEEGEALAQTALQHWPQIRDKPDCSHLVHDVYSEAGLDYEYATTNEIFDGVKSFQRVRKPQPGDLVVWQGHVGIVIDPEDHSFYSSVISGFSVSSYSSSYWERRGPRRFYRYRITEAQSGRLLQHASGGRPYATTVGPVPYETSFIANKKNLEDDSLEAEPDLPRRDSEPVVLSDNRVAGAVITSARKPTKEEIRFAFVKLSDANAAELEQSAILNSPIEIVDGFEIGKIETQGSSGWAELKIKKIAAFADGRMSANNGTGKVRFTLLQQSDGWILQDPANCSYLLRPAAVKMITARLAALARNPDNTGDLKPLTKALGILLPANHN